MSDKPILFNTEMVRALLDGRKVQTRRIVKCRNGEQPTELGLTYIGENLWVSPVNFDGLVDRNAFCPYGQPGDLLYVKEVCWMWGRWVKNGKTKTGLQAWKFKADEHDPRIRFDKPDWTVKRNGDVGWVYRHARFMPRRASRLILRITNIRVERVQDIAWQDAVREGIDCPWGNDKKTPDEWKPYPGKKPEALRYFKKLWNTVNGPDAWDRNDWVWVIEFEVIKQNVDKL